MKLLYQVEVGRHDLAAVMTTFDEYSAAPARVKEFAALLARGVLAHREEIDGAIASALTGWEPERLAAVDAQLLRVAVFELLHCEDIPVGVTLNEAIELSRQYSTESSSRFVNGVLAQVSARCVTRKSAG